MPNMNMGLADGNLSRRFSNLSKEQQDIIKVDRPGEINAETIRELSEDDRKQLKQEITEAEGRDAEKKQKEADAKREGEIQSVKDKGMGDDELEGGNRLIFIGTGSGGSSGADFNKNLTAMKNSTYYAATAKITGGDPDNPFSEFSDLKEISSITNNVEPVVTDKSNQKKLFELTQQSMVKVAAAKNAEKRDRLTNVLSKELGALLPDGLNNLKFANKLKQSLQIVFGYDIVDGKMKGKGRVQFVPQIGDPVSSAIIIENNEYVFDNTALQDMKEAGKTAGKVIKELTKQEIREKQPDDTPKEAPPPVPTQDNMQRGPKYPFDNFGGKKRKTYRKKKASKAKRSKAAKKTKKVRRKMRKSKR